MKCTITLMFIELETHRRLDSNSMTQETRLDLKCAAFVKKYGMGLGKNIKLCFYMSLNSYSERVFNNQSLIISSLSDRNLMGNFLLNKLFLNIST